MPSNDTRARAGSRELWLRAAVAGDAADCVSIQQAALAQETAAGARPHAPAEAGREQAWFRHLIGSPQAAGWAAQVDGRCAGFALTATQGGLHWLVSLFVDPAMQGQGLGRRLLECALGPPAERRLPVATFVDAASARAQGLYRSMGLHTVACALALSGSPQGVPSEGALALRTVGAADADAIEALDAALGVGPRPGEHAFWRANGWACRSLVSGSGEWQGYAVWSDEGRLGPLAVRQAEALPAALAACLRAMAGAGQAQARLLVPGENRAARAWLVDNGFRPAGMEVLMTDGRPPDWGRYVIHRAALP